MTRRPFALGLLLLSACAQTAPSPVPSVAPAPVKPVASRPVVVIMEFDNATANPDAKLGASAADVLTEALLKSGRVEVADRSQLARTLDEMKLQHSGASPSRAALGMATNAKYVIYGTVNECGQRMEKVNGLKSYIVESRVTINVLITEKGILADSRVAKGTATLQDTPDRKVSFDPGLVFDAVRDAIERAVPGIVGKLE